MVAKWLIVGIVIVVGSAQSAVAQAERKLRDPNRRPTVFDPNDPEKKRSVVTRAEREQLGLKVKNWDGVVQPEVYATLQGLNETLENARKNTHTAEAIDLLTRVQFPGTVYVQVRLNSIPEGSADLGKDPVALRDAQRRVLGSLTAAEFHVRQLFEQSAGFVGHASKEGLDKLATHPDVVSVCLDDQPLPETLPKADKSQFADPKPGEFSEEPGLKARRVEAKVYEGLTQSDRFFVAVSLESKGEPLPMLTDVPGEMQQRGREHDVAVRRLQDRVLSTLNADDFWLGTRLGSGFYGYINRPGLEKLWKHPEVTAIGLQGVKKTN